MMPNLTDLARSWTFLVLRFVCSCVSVMQYCVVPYFCYV